MSTISMNDFVDATPVEPEERKKFGLGRLGQLKEKFLKASNPFIEAAKNSPPMKVGAKIAKPVAAMNHRGQDLVDSRQTKFGKFGAQLAFSGAKSIATLAAVGGLISLLPAGVAASGAMALAGTALTTVGAVGMINSANTIRKEGNGSFIEGIKKNPQQFAKLLARGTMMLGGGAFIAGGISELSATELPSPALPDVPPVDQLGTEALESIQGDGIVSPVEAPIVEAAQNVASATPEVIAGMDTGEINKLSEDLLTTYDAVNDGHMGDTSVGRDMIDNGDITPGTVVAQADPELADNLLESGAQAILANPNTDLAASAPSEVVVESANNLANNNNFGDDRIAIDRYEAVADAGGPNAPVAQQSLEQLLANQELGVTSYQIQAGDNFESIVAKNDVYSNILDNIENPADRYDAQRAIIEKIADMNGIDNPNKIYAGQDIKMPDLSGVDPTTLQSTHDWADHNTKAGMEHFNKLKP